MHGIAVTLLTEDKERLTVLQQRLESTQMGRNVFAGHVGFPASPTDAILLRQLQDVGSRCRVGRYRSAERRKRAMHLDRS